MKKQEQIKNIFVNSNISETKNSVTSITPKR